MFYFLSERLPATKYHELHSGVVTTEEVQSEIISELKKNNTKYIVRFTEVSIYNEPNLSCVSSGIFLLDNYISSNFNIVEVFGDYQILHQIQKQSQIFINKGN